MSELHFLAHASATAALPRATAAPSRLGPAALADDEVLVRLRAIAHPAPPGRPSLGEPDTHVALGFDGAGTVSAAGRRSLLRPGQQVFGRFPGGRQHGVPDPEYARAAQWSAVALMPATADFAWSAGAIEPGVGALAMIEAVQPRPGERVLVAGRRSSVSLVLVQLLGRLGALVIAESHGDEQKLRALGAIEIVDGTRCDPSSAVRRRHPRGLDVVVDPVGDSAAVSGRAALLRAGGRLAALHGDPAPRRQGRRPITAVRVIPRVTKSRLTQLARLIDEASLVISTDAPGALRG